ncbi:MAG: hypothetical protein KDA75_06165 [Planctomycetaceae bacterium]|nr:hypothetical protein [Planctomycetaceae bacterium]
MKKPTTQNPQEAAKNERIFEIMLIVVTAGLAAVLHTTDGMKMVALNLFYLPVVLAGFFLGRYRAGILALLSVVVATIVIAQDLGGFASAQSPLMIGLAITMWGAVLGLTALLVGTLCDDLVTKAIEAHEAHVGVVEVLARYLQAANPHLESRAKRIANLCEKVARKMRLSNKEIDDIRVAALLMDIENIEITARVIKKAVGELEDRGEQQRTFHGSELVQSLGPVLSGAFPILLAQAKDDPMRQLELEMPFGCRIIRSVRSYVELADDPWETGDSAPLDLLNTLRTDSGIEHHPAVLHALQEVIESEESPEEGLGKLLNDLPQN